MSNYTFPPSTLLLQLHFQALNPPLCMPRAYCTPSPLLRTHVGRKRCTSKLAPSEQRSSTRAALGLSNHATLPSTAFLSDVDRGRSVACVEDEECLVVPVSRKWPLFALQRVDQPLGCP
eukprot:scaffold178109_cov15-Tisochrysis_lutea.AAC.1